MKKEALLINRGVNTDNIGDEAINFCLKHIFELHDVNVNGANFTIYFERTKGNKYFNFLLNVKRAISILRSKKYDLFIIGGGQLIQSNKTFPISFFLWSWLIYIFSKSKIIVYGVGVDDNFSRFHKLLFKHGFSRVKKIFVRDLESKINLKNTYNLESIVIEDSVFSISKIIKKPRLINETSDLLIGLTNFNSIKRYNHINVESENDYFNYILKNSPSLLNKNIRLICNTESDFKVTENFRVFLQSKFNIHAKIVKVNSLNEYISALVSSDNVISNRMHCLIIAYSYGVLVTPISRNKKLQFFSEYYKEIDVDEVYNRNIAATKSIVYDY